MSMHIQRFVDKLAGAEARNLKDLLLPIQDAKGLHQDITRLLMQLENCQTGKLTRSSADEIVEIKLSGGSFKDK